MARTRRAEIVEIVAVLVGFQAYLCWRPSLAADLTALGLLALLVPLLLWRRGETPRSVGLTDLGAQGRALVPLAAVAGLIVAGCIVFRLLHAPLRPTGGVRALLVALAVYPIWGLAQQVLYLAFVLRGLERAGLPGAAVVGLTAIAFGLVHQPNWPVCALTAGMGAVFALVYRRQPALLLIAAVHGLAGALALKVVGLDLEIGARYIR